MKQITSSQESAELIRNYCGIKPSWGMIFGSGLSGAADALEETVTFPYESLPGFLPSTVPGHSGRVVLGRWGGVWVAVFQGRTHVYEGQGLDPVLAAVRLCRELRIRNIIVTNAAGALRPPLSAGMLMAFSGHLNLTYLSGNGFTTATTLRTGIYDFKLRNRFLNAARRAGAPACEGVYAFLTGPTYETPAETRAYRTLGADAVGMSSVPESLEAAHLGMRVLAVSAITNDAVPATPGDSGPTHEAVLSTAKIASKYLKETLNIFFNDDKEVQGSRFKVQS